MLNDLHLKPRPLRSIERWIDQCEECSSFVKPGAKLCESHLIEKYGLSRHETYDALDHLGTDKLFEGEAVVELLSRIDAVLEPEQYAAITMMRDCPFGVGDKIVCPEVAHDTLVHTVTEVGRRGTGWTIYWRDDEQVCDTRMVGGRAGRSARYCRLATRSERKSGKREESNA